MIQRHTPVEFLDNQVFTSWKFVMAARIRHGPVIPNGSLPPWLWAVDDGDRVFQNLAAGAACFNAYGWTPLVHDWADLCRIVQCDYV